MQDQDVSLILTEEWEQDDDLKRIRSEMEIAKKEKNKVWVISLFKEVNAILRARNVTLQQELPATMGEGSMHSCRRQSPHFAEYSDLAHAIRLAFQSEYMDPNQVIDRFMASIAACRGQWCNPLVRTLYAPYFAVVQASMMGKSRLFFRLAEKQVFVFYICLGRRDSSVYPRSNPALVEALSSRICTEGFYAAFLLGSMMKLIEFRRSNPHANGTAWIRQQKDADTFWASILGIFSCVAIFLFP